MRLVWLSQLELDPNIATTILYSGFTCDETRLIHAMRLFIGQPVWTPFNRPQEEHPSRKKYETKFLEEKKEETA